MLNHLSQVEALRWVAYKNSAYQLFFYNNCCTWLIKIVKETSMEMKYICDIYNFWSREYILASFKYTTSKYISYIYIFSIFFHVGRE